VLVEVPFAVLLMDEGPTVTWRNEVGTPSQRPCRAPANESPRQSAVNYKTGRKAEFLSETTSG